MNTNLLFINFQKALKTCIKIIFNKSERLRYFNELNIIKQQDNLIRDAPRTLDTLIVFFVPGIDRQTYKEGISGGVISIVSLCEETKRIFAKRKGIRILLCTLPDEYLILKFHMFKNDMPIFRFDQLAHYFKKIDNLLFHIPEYTVSHFYKSLKNMNHSWIKGCKKIHFNILNQNINLMPPSTEIQYLYNYANMITISTAHVKYCNMEVRAKYNVPLHHFSVWVSPEKYFYKSFSEKENILLVSPDDHPLKSYILESLTVIPWLEIIIIKNITYEKYKQLISKAKWMLTFGEGLDGYFVETVFSGGLAFSVYNHQFFTPDFENGPTIYPSYDILAEKICNDITYFNTENIYISAHKHLFGLCSNQYNGDRYRENIHKFYQQKYTIA